MTLTTEDMGDLSDVDPAAMDELLASDGFGKFAVLSVSDEAFLQAGNNWQPTPECEAFMAEHGSDPWVLEYRADGQQFRAAGPVTLDQVRKAFLSYLTAGPEWRTGVRWAALDL
ncbi:hypothetical protein J0H58_37725 [bacterium]|nr:hypothetical protein [bacterium]